MLSWDEYLCIAVFAATMTISLVMFLVLVLYFPLVVQATRTMARVRSARLATSQPSDLLATDAIESAVLKAVRCTIGDDQFPVRREDKIQAFYGTVGGDMRDLLKLVMKDTGIEPTCYIGRRARLVTVDDVITYFRSHARARD